MLFSGVTWPKSAWMIGALPLVNLPWSVAVPMYNFPCALNLTSMLPLVEPPPGLDVLTGGGELVVGLVPPPGVVTGGEDPGRHWEYPIKIRVAK